MGSGVERALVRLTNRSFASQALLFALGAALLFITWYCRKELLLIFGGILFGIFLNGLSSVFSRTFRLPYRWALALVSFLLLLTAVGGIYGFFNKIADSAHRLTTELNDALQYLKEQMSAYPAIDRALDELPSLSQISKQSEVWSLFGTVLTGTVAVVVAGLVMIFIGVYAASEPTLYERRFVRLFVPRKRVRVLNVFSEIRDTLWHWLLGRLITMTITGTLTALGLYLLGIPLAITLGVLAGVLSFVPNLGPVAAAIPGVLFGFEISPTMALNTIGVYIAVQTVESYLITPIVQRYEVEIAPAILLIAQLILGTLAGLVGLLFATPLVAAAGVALERFYVEDFLERRRGSEE